MDQYTNMAILHKTEDGSNTLYSDRYQQTYHSRHGAATESLHVFLSSAGVTSRLHTLTPTRVLEMGFGTGLNFFLTADQALKTQTELAYWSIEQNLLAPDLIARLEFEHLLDHQDLIKAFISWRANLAMNPADGLYTFQFNDNLRLHLIIGNAIDCPLPNLAFDAVYLDAFSPDKNPELWTISFLSRLACVTAPNARLTTYSARGLVRRNLDTAGFDVQKMPGPPGKREMIVATRRSSLAP